MTETAPIDGALGARLLAWYDRAARVLPWRAPSGTRQDPYRVWLSEMMLQQTTVAAVGPYFRRFLSRWPDIAALAAAPREEVLREWAGLGYDARARNLHDCARRVVAEHGADDAREHRALNHGEAAMTERVKAQQAEDTGVSKFGVLDQLAQPPGLDGGQPDLKVSRAAADHPPADPKGEGP
jgi:hypothetical protein